MADPSWLRYSWSERAPGVRLKGFLLLDITEAVVGILYALHSRSCAWKVPQFILILIITPQWKLLGCVWLFVTLWLYSPWNSPGQNTGVDSLSLLHGIFPTQGLNLGLLHCRQILYQLSHQESPGILEWVAFPFSSRFSWPRNWTRVLLHCRWILYLLSYWGSS